MIQNNMDAPNNIPDTLIWETEQHINYAVPRNGLHPESYHNGVSTAQDCNFNNKNDVSFYNPRLINVQSKFRRKYYHKVVFIGLILIIISLLIAIIIITSRVRTALRVCETRECLRSAASLLQTMDQSVDPCEDFYQFACGNWAEEHPRPDSATSHDWFTDRQAKIILNIRKSLQTNITNEDPQAIKKAKTMYRACMNIEEMDTLGLKPLVKYLSDFKLPLLPSYFNRTEMERNYFDWVESIVRVKQSMGLDIIIGFDIFPDPTDRRINRVAIGTPETGAALPFKDEHYLRMQKAKRKMINEEPIDEQEKADEMATSSALTVYLSYIRRILQVMMVFIEPRVKIEDINEEIVTAAMEIVKITKFLYTLTEEAENFTKGSTTTLEEIEYLTVKDFQQRTDEKIFPKSLSVWERFIKMMFDNLIGTDFNTKTDRIITSEPDIKYLQEVSTFLIETPAPNIELFIWWSVVEELITHTTSNLRRLHTEYTESVVKTEGSLSRSLYCSSGVNTMLGMAVSRSIIDDSFLSDIRPKVETMLLNIQNAFNSLVKSTDWMDLHTKEKTLQKSMNMKSFIGFPEWILNGTHLDKYYTGIDAYDNTHLDNMMGVLKWTMLKKLKSLVELNDYEWATSPSNVNAFHTFQANTITVPMAILQYPFYDLGLEALNYGAIGTILGHELTHGFDDSGRMFDKNGNMRQWWSNKTITEYVSRTTCFVKQYGNYHLPDINQNINGDLTLGENIADNGGLREAFYAYKLLMNSREREDQLLPGLEKFTHEQLFFISFGNLWCESYTPTGLRYALEDSHCPGKIRLQGVLSNSQEFSQTFACRKGSGMYPGDDRCRIW